MHYWTVLSAITDTCIFVRKSMMGKPCIIPGTRPEAIKMSPVVRACERRGVDWFVVHTGQGCSCDVDRVFSGRLGLPDAGYNLDIGSGSGRHGERTGT
ncbi:MAG: UDP-N-acetylglucosamine 2-epimerase [Candidatus Methanospirareceae archaeon]